MSRSAHVIGFGAWGAALAHHLAQKGLAVTAWSRNKELLAACNGTERIHPKLGAGIPLDKKISLSDDPSSVAKAEFIILAIPAAALSTLKETLSKIHTDALVVSAIKGLESNSCETPLQYLERATLIPSSRLIVLSGPSFARDVASGKPVAMVAASKNLNAAKEVAELFSSPALRVYSSEDPLGVELGGIAKNVIAIAAGVCDALNLGPSARSGIITRGLAEMMRLAEAFGGSAQTLCGLSGLGDLVLTATDNMSRNRTVGLRLGAGESLPEILKTLGSAAEGVHTAPLLAKIAKAKGVDMPITQKVVELIEGKIDCAKLAGALLSRPLKEEF